MAGMVEGDDLPGRIPSDLYLVGDMQQLLGFPIKLEGEVGRVGRGRRVDTVGLRVSE